MTRDEDAVLYYQCSSCKGKTRDDEVHKVEEFGLMFCPSCKPDMHTLMRIAEGLRNLPDIPGQRVIEQSATFPHQ